MDNWKPGAALETLKRRAELIDKIRHFFKSRGILEIETPCLARHPAVDLHLDSFTVKAATGTVGGYLITSPEYHMKRLLTAGSGSIFQLTKAFRCDEAGSRHNPEFTILEWYRNGWNHWELMEEIDALLQEVLDTDGADYLSYCEAFQKYLAIDPLQITAEQFSRICQEKQVSPPADLLSHTTDRDEWLNYLMGLFIEPRLGIERPVFLNDYPASQANLARLYDENPQFAMRFEVYYQGLELGNGFCELTDGDLQHQRFIEENEAREKIGKNALPIDHNFIDALKSGMPECAGVAIGVDRLIMLALGLDDIEKVMAFSWIRA